MNLQQMAYNYVWILLRYQLLSKCKSYTWNNLMFLGGAWKQWTVQREEVTLKQSGTNSTVCSGFAVHYVMCFIFRFHLNCYVFTFIQLLIKSFLCEDVFAILGTTWSFPFNNNIVCRGPRHVTFKKKKNKTNHFLTFSMWLVHSFTSSLI